MQYTKIKEIRKQSKKLNKKNHLALDANEYKSDTELNPPIVTENSKNG